MHRSLPAILKSEPNIAQPLKKQKEVIRPEVCMPTPRLISLHQPDHDIDKTEVTSSTLTPAQSVNQTDGRQISTLHILEAEKDLQDISNLTQTITYLDGESTKNYVSDLSTASNKVKQDMDVEGSCTVLPSTVVQQEYEVVIHDSLTDDENSLPTPPSARPLKYCPASPPVCSLSDNQYTISHPSIMTSAMDTGITESFLDTNSNNSVDLDGHMADQAIGNVMTLPKIFTEVMHMQKDQNDEIQRQVSVLHETEKLLCEVISYNDELQDEISNIANEAFVIQESAKKKNKFCELHSNEIKNLVSACETIRTSLAEKQEEFKNDDRNIEEYRKKIKKFSDGVKTYECSQQLLLDLKQQEITVNALKAKKTARENGNDDLELLLNGTLEAKLKETVSQLREDIKLQEGFLKEKNTVIQNLKDKQNQIVQSTRVLNKRNTAHLTRLRRQLKEVTLRKKRWREQISQLQCTIVSLQHKLKE